MAIEQASQIWAGRKKAMWIVLMIATFMALMAPVCFGMLQLISRSVPSKANQDQTPHISL